MLKVKNLSKEKFHRNLLKYVTLIMGTVFIFVSLYLRDILFLYIGIGIISISISMLFLMDDKIMKTNLVEFFISNQLITMYQIFKHLKITNSIYYPSEIMNLNPIQNFYKSSDGLKTLAIYPLGTEIFLYIEKTLNSNIIETPFEYIVNHIKKVFKEDFQLITDFNIEVFDNIVRITLYEYILFDLCKRICEQDKNICNIVTCSLCSSIICVLVKFYNKPVKIIDHKFNNNNNIEFNVMILN